MPFCGIGFLIGFAFGCLLSYLGHPRIGAAMIPVFFFSGLLGDFAQMGWRVYWRWTQECAWCGKRVSPLTRNRVLSNDLKHGKFWFCSPRCLTEWHRRHFSERKQFNFLTEGGPLIKFPKE